MFHHSRQKEHFGRYIPKPEAKTTKDEVELFEEAVPITQQIENLRTKISLQERYNAALKDNLEESTKGSYDFLRHMFHEVHSLRIQLKEAVNKEKWAVNNALRTHRIFQLSLKYSTPSAAVQWMDDKLFDNAKILNSHIDRLIRKRKKLEEVENDVEMLEKWPVPGSLPWEIRLGEKQRLVEVAQASTKLRLECAREMRNKYKAISWKLRTEKDLYGPIIRNLSSQLNSQLTELAHLEDMLRDAQKFEQDAEESLEWTEREAHANRKQRRAQIAKMRKEMERMVIEEQKSLSAMKPPAAGGHSEMRGSKDSGQERAGLYGIQSLVVAADAEVEQNERLAQKRALIDTYNDNAALLVDVMKIPNLTHIPQRMDDVIQLSKILKEEKESKEKLKQILIKQRDQLSQLFCIIRYTGNKQLEQNNMVLRDYQKNLKELGESLERERNYLNKDGELFCDLQLGIQSLLQRIEGIERKSIRVQNSDHLLSLLQTFQEKLEGLCDTVDTMKTELKQRRKSIITPKNTRPPVYNTPARFVRVGDPVQDEFEESDGDEFDDWRVPGRQELKAQSDKIVHQALLRLGFAAARQKEQETKALSKKQPKFPSIDKVLDRAVSMEST